jgi:hypothetical protein
MQGLLRSESSENEEALIAVSGNFRAGALKVFGAEGSEYTHVTSAATGLSTATKWCNHVAKEFPPHGEE